MKDADSQPAARTEFPCANCGAPMHWDPSVDALRCEYCETRLPVPRARAEIVERPLEAAGDAARGLGLEVRVARCSECGARVTYGESSIAEVCVYCGAPAVLAQDANRNAIRPESLVPLDVGSDQVRDAFRRWLRRLWFRPNDLVRSRAFDAGGVYVPFWSFDARVHSDWSADAGYYETETVTRMRSVNGRIRPVTETRRKIRWVPAWGRRDDRYDDFLILASRGLSESLVSDLGGFDTGALVPYRPEYLAGWRAEEYAVDLSGAWEKARSLIGERQRALCAGDVPGDTHRDLRVRTDIEDVRWKHVLLPIWTLQYRYRGKVYTVLINGQTGRVAGEAPYSWVKILLFAVAVGLAVFAVFVLSRL